MMKLKYEQTFCNPANCVIEDGGPVELKRIQCLTISPNMTKMAVCFSQSNTVALFDLISNEEKDKFALKAATKGGSRKSFVVKGMCFALDSEKIAIGQSDCVIYVYRIGDSW